MSEKTEQERRFWDQWAKNHIQDYDVDFKSHVHDFVLDYCAKDERERQILEMGCGSESFFTQCDAKKIFGLDISKTQLGRYPHTPILGDIKQFTSNDSFDVILFPASLHHCPEEYKGILANVYKHLNELGVLALIEPNLFHPHRIALKLGLIKAFSPGEEPLNPFSIDKFLTKNQRMNNCHLEYCNIYPPNTSKRMLIQQKLLGGFKRIKLLHPLIYPWFFGVYQKG
ncbi:MAG: class I SAM-dependent methyltransferase [Candidatus Altiarchaeota archaeon]